MIVRKKDRLSTILKFLSLLTNGNNLFLVVRTTSLANSVRHHKSTALAALYEIGSSHLPVSSATVSPCLGMFVLRTNSTHGFTPP